ncbi:MAG: amidohydrolase [Acidobacteriia bacterium]|nr:amidohydrolase [Terriglobia bacterium]
MRRRDFLSGIASAGASSLLPSNSESAQEIALQPKYHYDKPVIDAHFHWYPPEFAALIEREGAANGVTDIKRNEKGELECVVPGNHPYAPRALFRSDMTDVNLMLKAMDDRHVDMCTLTQTNPHILWAPPAFGAKLARAINDASSALCVKYPKRFTAAITLPVQYVNASLEELERARKLPGMKAVNFPENVLGKNIDDKSFWPVYERAEALNLPIFLHNLDPISERLVEKNYTMINILGNPFEATIAATSLILGGVMDEFPKLDVFFPHGGGFIAFATPRIDWAMGTATYSPRGRTNTYKNLKLPRASDYLRRFHYDLAMHDPKLTRTLIDIVGADRVVCGTDFPQGMSIRTPVEYVEAIPNITQQERELILCENPARLLRL